MPWNAPFSLRRLRPEGVGNAAHIHTQHRRNRLPHIAETARAYRRNRNPPPARFHIHPARLCILNAEKPHLFILKEAGIPMPKARNPGGPAQPFMLKEVGITMPKARNPSGLAQPFILKKREITTPILLPTRGRTDALRHPISTPSLVRFSRRLKEKW